MNVLNVTNVVPIIYRHLLTPPRIMVDVFRNLFNKTTKHSGTDMQVNQLDMTEDVATQGVIMDVYRSIHEEVLSTEHMGGPFTDDRPVSRHIYRFKQNICQAFP